MVCLIGHDTAFIGLCYVKIALAICKVGIPLSVCTKILVQNNCTPHFYKETARKYIFVCFYLIHVFVFLERLSGLTNNVGLDQTEERRLIWSTVVS